MCLRSMGVAQIVAKKSYWKKIEKHTDIKKHTTFYLLSVLAF